MFNNKKVPTYLCLKKLFFFWVLYIIIVKFTNNLQLDYKLLTKNYIVYYNTRQVFEKF